MRRRRFCATALLVVGLAGCPSGGGTGTAPPGRTRTETPTSAPDAGDSTPTGTGSPTETESPTATESPTDTVPSLTRELGGIRVENRRDSAVTLDLAIAAKESDESRTFAVALDAGQARDFDDLSILDQPVTVTATLAGETYEHEPSGQGRLLVLVTPDGVVFEEVVT